MSWFKSYIKFNESFIKVRVFLFHITKRWVKIHNNSEGSGFYLRIFGQIILILSKWPMI